MESTEQRVAVTAVLTRRQATTVLRSVPWVGRAVARWLVGVLLTVLSGVPLVVVGTGSLVWGGCFAALLVLLLANTFLRAPWTGPAQHPVRHGVGHPVTWTFSASGVGIESVVGTGFRPWSVVDAVERRGSLLVVRRQAWATGVPLASLDADAVARITAWHAAAPPAPERAPEPRASREGHDLVVVGRPTAAQVREPLVAWARTLHRDPVRLLLVAAPVVLLVWAAASGDAVRARAAWLAPLGWLLTAGVVELVVRLQVRSAQPHGWRVSERGVGIAVDGAWHHVPWQRVTRVTFTRPFLVVAVRDLEDSVVVPLADLPADAVTDVLGWCRAAGVRVAGRVAGRVPDPR